MRRCLRLGPQVPASRCSIALGLDAEEVVMVGDSEGDVRCAREVAAASSGPVGTSGCSAVPDGRGRGPPADLLQLSVSSEGAGRRFGVVLGDLRATSDCGHIVLSRRPVPLPGRPHRPEPSAGAFCSGRPHRPRAFGSSSSAASSPSPRSSSFFAPGLIGPDCALAPRTPRGLRDLRRPWQSRRVRLRRLRAAFASEGSTPNRAAIAGALSAIRVAASSSSSVGVVRLAGGSHLRVHGGEAQCVQRSRVELLLGPRGRGHCSRRR